MKIKILAIVCLLFVGYTQTNAQSIAEFRKMDIPTKSQLLTDSVHILLGLNDIQTQRMHTIITNGLTEIQPIANADISRFSKWKKLRGLRHKYQDQVKAVLTKEQWNKWEYDKKELIAYYKKQIGSIPFRTSIQ